ncbi:hypothetical protein GS500_22665 [Rhodococcus hoagii]|nr:hypothetical protein [Prescottella equi]
MWSRAIPSMTRSSRESYDAPTLPRSHPRRPGITRDAENQISCSEPDPGPPRRRLHVGSGDHLWKSAKRATRILFVDRHPGAFVRVTRGDHPKDGVEVREQQVRRRGQSADVRGASALGDPSPHLPEPSDVCGDDRLKSRTFVGAPAADAASVRVTFGRSTLAGREGVADQAEVQSTIHSMSAPQRPTAGPVDGIGCRERLDPLPRSSWSPLTASAAVRSPT